MSDLISIAGSAVAAYQRALSTVSNNIANVNTEGYSRQEVDLKDSAPKQMASMYIGTGVMLQNIKRQYDINAIHVNDRALIHPLRTSRKQSEHYQCCRTQRK